jgi:DNA polymerase-3 subunit gamma/tau
VKADALPLQPDQWTAIIQQMAEQSGLSGLARQLASNCALAGRQGAVVRLLLDPRHASIRTPANQEKLQTALSRYTGEALRLQVDLADGEAPPTPARQRDRMSEERLANARAALESDPAIQALRTQMGATIFADSIRPNHEEN